MTMILHPPFAYGALNSSSFFAPSARFLPFVSLPLMSDSFGKDSLISTPVSRSPF